MASVEEVRADIAAHNDTAGKIADQAITMSADLGGLQLGALAEGLDVLASSIAAQGEAYGDLPFGAVEEERRQAEEIIVAAIDGSNRATTFGAQVRRIGDHHEAATGHNATTVTVLGEVAVALRSAAESLRSNAVPTRDNAVKKLDTTAAELNAGTNSVVSTASEYAKVL